MIKPGGKGLLIALAGGKDAAGVGDDEPGDSASAEETPKAAAASAVMSALQANDSEAFAEALETFIENCR